MCIISSEIFLKIFISNTFYLLFLFLASMSLMLSLMPPSSMIPSILLYFCDNFTFSSTSFLSSASSSSTSSAVSNSSMHLCISALYSYFLELIALYFMGRKCDFSCPFLHGDIYLVCSSLPVTKQHPSVSFIHKTVLHIYFINSF